MSRTIDTSHMRPGDPVVIRDRQDKPIHTSRNLRGLITHGRRSVPVSVTLERRKDGEGAAYVNWLGGDYCVTVFASYAVMREWMLARRTWRHAGTAIWEDGENIQRVSA